MIYDTDHMKFAVYMDFPFITFCRFHFVSLYIWLCVLYGSV